jgi:DNA-binding GntR family transcriptional regulator
MIDPRADRPVYKQLADILRHRIGSGSFIEGEMLPSAAALAQTYVVGTDTVRRALAVLRLEGLVDTVPKLGSFVRVPPKTEVIEVNRGRITARMPVQDERRALDIPEGIPLLIIESGDRTELLPADRAIIEIAGK